MLSKQRYNNNCACSDNVTSVYGGAPVDAEFVSSSRSQPVAMFPFVPTPNPPIFFSPPIETGIPVLTNSPAAITAIASSGNTEGSDSPTVSLHSSLSPVTPASSPEMPMNADVYSPVTSSSPTLDAEKPQPSEYSLNDHSVVSLQSCASTSSAYLSAYEEQSYAGFSPPATPSTPLHTSPSRANPQFPHYSLLTSQSTPIHISPLDYNMSEEEDEGKEGEKSFQRAVSLESVASTVTDEVQHLSFPPPYFVDLVSVEPSPSPPPSALPEWTPTKQEVFQMRSYIAGTSKMFPHLWHKTVHFIKEKLEEERCCIGRHTITNGLLEVLAEAVYSNLISALLLVEELLPDFRGKSVNQLFTFHPLYNSLAHHHPVELERDSSSCPTETLLHVAVRQNRPNLVRVLIQDLEASPNEEDSNSLTPLHIAVLNAIRFSSQSSQALVTAITIISYLLESGADANKQTDDGLTPLAMAVRYLLFSEMQPQLSPSLHKKQSDNPLQSLSTQAAPPADGLLRKLMELLLSHGATPETSLHHMSFLHSTFTASLQSCSAEELINRLIPTTTEKEQQQRCEEKFVRDVRSCSINTQSRLFALSGCQLVFQELRQHRLMFLSLLPSLQSSSQVDINPSYLLLPVVPIKQYWMRSLQKRRSSDSDVPTSKPCEAYYFRRELETVEDLEEMWKSPTLTDEIVYQSLIIMEQCLGCDDLITLEMVLLTHSWLITAMKTDSGNLLFLHFLESLVSHVENIPLSDSIERFLQLLELENFITTVVAGTDIGSILLSLLSPHDSDSCNPIEQSPQEYVKFASCLIPALSVRVSQCPSHLTTGHLVSVDKLVSITLQNAMSLIASRVSSCGAKGSLVRWMTKELVRACAKVCHSDGSCTTILHVAIEMTSDLRLVSALLELGAKAVLNEPRRRGFRFDLPIHTAKTKDMVRLLIEQGAHHDAVDSDGRTASELYPFVWSDLPDKILQSCQLPPLVCLASRAVARSQVPYRYLDIPSAVMRLIQLHSPV